METLSERSETVKFKGEVRNKTSKADTMVLLGYGLLSASVILYVLVDYGNFVGRSDQFTVFISHYLIALIYVVSLLINGSYGIRKSWRKQNINKTIILLNLFLVSAFALNRELPVFAESSFWLTIFLIVTSLFTLSYNYFDVLNSWLNCIQHLVLGSAIMLYFYQAIFVANFYGVGAVGILFFGIGAHIFVPLTLLVGCIFLIRHNTAKNNISPYWVLAGATLTIGIVLLYMGEWNQRVSKIEKIANQAVLHKNEGLPLWVEIAQNLENDWLSEMILKSDLVYTTHNKDLQWDSFSMRLPWREAKKHDPLVFISTLISRCTLSANDRVKILQSVFSDRHNANERLWSGDNLTTSYIVSDVDIYPALRLAYTEKYLSIRNNLLDGRGTETQEAIYTFQLPEGSVVTSLSLWIEGKEEKAILTSKQKATEAYNTIVGVERRDPSVVHWQEGNLVTVRVFPCTPDEERKFKIGITSPLVEIDGNIIFKNITFTGPSAHRSMETFRVRFIGNPDNLELSEDFKKDMKGNYVAERLYDPDFQLLFKADLLAYNQFSFDGFTYSMQPLQLEYEHFKFQRIFLDINAAWTRQELSAIKVLLDDFKVYALLDHDFVRVTNDNWEQLVESLHKRNFSLFPFQRLTKKNNCLVITKGKGLSPHLSDINGSAFADEAVSYLAAESRPRVYNLGGDVSTYVSSLRELRAIQFANGSVEQLRSWLNKEQFPRSKETDNSIILHDAKMLITRVKYDGHSKSNAPDHLARLFAYNDIMRRIGTKYFSGDFRSEDLVEAASKAYVVSPVSSLIVLETEKDYKRFGIEDNINGLQNAVKESTGAVPEPHEWILIIVFLLFICYLKLRRLKVRYSL
jgi:XrtN system VIT domain protein